jgi:uncharacterized protein
MTQMMRGAVDHPLVKKIMAYQAAMARQDFAEGAAIFAPDVVYNVPGKNPLSGKYVGPKAVMDYFGNLMALTRGTYEITDMLWLACNDRVTLVTRNQAMIGNQKLAWDEAIIFEFVDGFKKRIDLFQADQAAVDQFFSDVSAQM